jgi:hypothetical protein
MFSSFCFLRRYKKAFFPTCAIAWSSAAVFSLQETPFLVQFLALQIALMLVSRACLGKIVLMARPEPVLERKANHLEREAISTPKRQSPFFLSFLEQSNA